MFKIHLIRVESNNPINFSWSFLFASKMSLLELKPSVYSEYASLRNLIMEITFTEQIPLT